MKQYRGFWEESFDRLRAGAGRGARAGAPPTMMAADVMPDMAQQGWSSQFDKLDELLSAD